MATSFETQFAINGFMGYNLGCMIASDTLFDSRGGFLGTVHVQRRCGLMSNYFDHLLFYAMYALA